ncbi:MAG: CoA-acylating methylmalonate-semialdehyde dehydrogenase [Solirubrobacterales bacterium]|nr:CoA-acylating methylmalonate-semialdehyde dehydrogenase [Solirubrobacterales bacterium]
MNETAPDAKAITLRNYIGGEWLEFGGETLESRNPATGELLNLIPLSSADDIDAAVTAARAAFPSWSQTSPIIRARALFALREVLTSQREEIARLVTLDMGKTFDDAFGEVGRGIESVEAACAIPHTLKGQTLEGVARNVDVESFRQPLGVVAAITPFNFPAMIPLWFLPFALACGNTFILKPSEQDPLASRRIVELIDGIDEIPAGVVNLVHGAHDAVNALLDHPEIDAISFVGKASTARYIAQRGVEKGKRVQALGGAKNSLVVMPDADPELTAAGVTSSAFGAAGQRCLAGSVLLLVGTPEEQERSLGVVVDAAKQLRTGDGSDPETDVCPLVNPAARESAEAAVADALAGGAKLILDGRRDGGSGGAELGPTIVDDLDSDHPVTRDEIFGPVLGVVRAPDLDAALEWLNKSRYGNAAMIFTADGGHAREFRNRVQAGMVGVNIGVAAPIAWFPFSGWKDSIDGDLHANGDDAVTFYTRSKVVTSRWR